MQSKHLYSLQKKERERKKEAIVGEESVYTVLI